LSNEISNNIKSSTLKPTYNISKFNNIESDVLKQSREETQIKLKLMNQLVSKEKVYDDDILLNISKRFKDRIFVKPIISDILRALNISIKRNSLKYEEFITKALNLLNSNKRIARSDIASLTKITAIRNNNIIPFLNGGHIGENWNIAENGFYDWIDNKSTESILCIELGFKADSYGLEVSKKLIDKKKLNPNIHISLLIDGFVSILRQKPPSTLNDFEKNTLYMIQEMRKVGIDVIINHSWNPLSSDFLAATHIKLWIFDSEIAFIGGIGIESQFRKLLFDEMDLVEGQFVNILVLMALLIMFNQRKSIDIYDNTTQLHEIEKEQFRKLFLKKPSKKGNITMELSMNVPGYIHDAQQEYIKLLDGKYVDEIYILAPYFSDDKVARAVIRAATRLQNKMNNNSSRKKISKNIFNIKKYSDYTSQKSEDKKIHIMFPKKQESRIIEEVSRYYAYYLRNNPIVETKQYYSQIQDNIYEMSHAKQMVVVLKNPKTEWTKYIKFGGSYNPAGRSMNMWEMNAMAFYGKWNESDEDVPVVDKNPIKKYLDSVMKPLFEIYSEPFPWGDKNIELSWWNKFTMRFSQLLWV